MGVQRGELPLRENTYKSKKDKMKIIIKKTLGVQRGELPLWENADGFLRPKVELNNTG